MSCGADSKKDSVAAMSVAMDFKFDSRAKLSGLVVFIVIIPTKMYAFLKYINKPLLI
jgi:hypothetical protein